MFTVTIFVCAFLASSSIAQSPGEVKCLTCYDKLDCVSDPIRVLTCDEEQVAKNHRLIGFTNSNSDGADPKGPYICYDYETMDQVDPENDVKYLAGKGCTTVAVAANFCQGWIPQLDVVRCRTCLTADGCSSLDASTTTASTAEPSSSTGKTTPAGGTTANTGSSSNRNGPWVVPLLLSSVLLIFLKESR
ncbi:uncharacterized protein LOC129740319 [Uranotaenia lowii]|uniref:uncharacterized protein LOC129740319 n=1 Tax=Uranotaenia lowii TaxID=190385 RepID=UPI002479F9D4|nr:uncharacterized protein LOC129740319 [Uranotaenia lowii]